MTVNSVQTTNKNTCPHGMPQGSCPICNGMMSGGGRASRADNAKSKNEWSWMKCYIEGQMMRGREARHEEQVKLSQAPLRHRQVRLKAL